MGQIDIQAEEKLLNTKFLSLVDQQMTERTKSVIQAGLDALARKPEALKGIDLATSVIIIAGDSADRVGVTFAPKQGLEATLKDAGFAKFVEPKLIATCMKPTPADVARILFITTDMVGTCQVGSSLNFLGSDKTTENVKDQIRDVLSPFPKSMAREVIQEALQCYDVIDAIMADHPELSSEAQNLLPSMIPEFQEMWGGIEKRAHIAPAPITIETALDVESLVMAAAYCMAPLNDFSAEGAGREALQAILTYFARRTPALHGLFTKLSVLYPRDRENNEVSDKLIAIFGVDWLHSGFPKVEVGHKLAASFALTDVPDDIEVHAPWKAWSLIIPDGLLPNVISVNDAELKEPSSFARAWCMGPKVRYLVLANGHIIGPLSDHQKNSSSHVLAAQALVQSVCLAISNPDDYKKRAISSPSSTSKKAQRQGLPDFSCTRFLISAPVQIDLRDHLKEVIAGKAKGGGGPSNAQFFVRGHWRNQVHGKGRLLRKQIRIEGFWKGDPNARILLKNYKLKDEPVGDKREEGETT